MRGRAEQVNAEVIARALSQSGVECAFVLPGGELAGLIDACRGEGIRLFLVGHETSGAFMAEVVGQISGRPGVCMATLGPGAMNLSLGVANAFLDRAPLVAITAAVPLEKEAYFSHQRLPLNRIFEHFTKESILLDGRETEAQVRQAFQLAVTPRFGPVHLALPSDVALRPVRSIGAPAQVVVPNRDPTPESASIEEAITLLTGTRMPLLLVGLGCRLEDVPALRAFQAATRMPFVVTPKAKGALPEDSTRFLGVVGGMALDNVMLETLEYADLLLGVGFDPVECDKDWFLGRSVVNVSRAPTAEAAYRPVELVGDIATILTSLGDRLERTFEWPENVLIERREAIRVASDRLNGTKGVSPLAAIRAIREVTPRDAILTSDVGSHKYYAGQFWEAYEPQTFFVSNGLSAMGFGVPAAIAVKLMLPHRAVVSVVGDGGMLMMLHNLTFMRQYQVPVVIVVFVDESLSLIRITQERKGFVPCGVDFAAPNFAAVAEGFSLEGVRADSIDALKRAVEAALKHKTPTVIHLPIDVDEYYDFV